MVTTTATGLTRVMIVAPNRRFAVALPSRLALAALMPNLVRQAEDGRTPQSPTVDGGVGADAAPTGGWLLRRLDGTVLDLARPLAAQDIKDGEVLHLVAGDAQWPEIQYDDMVEAIAAGSRAYGTGWTPAATRRAGLGAAVISLLVALAAIMQAGPPWPLKSGLVIGIGLVLLLTGTILARAAGDSMAGAAFATTALPYLFAGGVLVLAGDDPLTSLGAPHLLVGATAMLLGAIIAHAAVSDGEGLLLAGVVCAVAAAAGAGIGLSPLDGAESAAVLLALLVLIHPLLPLLAVRLGKVPIPTMPRTADDLVSDPEQPATSKVLAATQRGNQILFGLIGGVSLSSAVCLVLTASAGGTAAPLLTAVASLALLLRARVWRTVQLRTPMLLAGSLGAVLCVLGLAAHIGGAYALTATVAALVLIAAALAAVGLVFGKRSRSPYPGRIADILDIIVVLAVVPIAAGVLNLYDSMLGLRELL